MFGLTEKEWKDKNGLNTAKEIYQQPELWLETIKIIEQNKNEIEGFLKRLSRNKNTKVIFTGAGTSAYVGEIIVPYLNSKYDCSFEAIATTDIVSNPSFYLKRESPTIIVSFARSGNSPESVATYKLAEKLVEDISHIFVTCNPEGELAKIAEGNENILLLLMPERSNDKGFAMTSSFTNMLLGSLLTFDINSIDEIKDIVTRISKLGTNIINNAYRNIQELVKLGYDRVVYLGSGSLSGLARESALKLLELTRGKVVSNYESILGFRHGPKSIVNDKTLVFAYISEDEYTRRYDLDLVKEVYGESGEHKLVTISQSYDEELEKHSDYHWFLNNEKKGLSDEVYSAVAYVLYAQIFALMMSEKLGIEPDNPSPSGTVNRVVKGVTIYDYKIKRSE